MKVNFYSCANNFHEVCKREPRRHEYLTKTGVDMASSQKLVVTNQIIFCKSQNKVVTNNSLFTVLEY